jgi:hypothetical protein
MPERCLTVNSFDEDNAMQVNQEVSPRSNSSFIHASQPIHSNLEQVSAGANKVRGRKAKATKAPTRVERQELLYDAIRNLKDDLENAGFGPLLKLPTTLKPIAEPVEDPKTGGLIGHIEEELGTYIQRVGIRDNFFQRQPFDHSQDKIYRRLIKDFIEGAAMPEAKVAALGSSAAASSLDETGVKYSVIDGLQRLYCYCIAILLVLRGEKLLESRCISKEAWEYFRPTIEQSGNSTLATEKLLKRIIRYEIFWKIGLQDLLHYMVTFNTGQRAMSVQVQLEIMRRPLLDALIEARIPVWLDTHNIPGQSKPKDQFAASDLVLAARAFIEANPQLKKPDEAADLLEAGAEFDFDTASDVGNIQDVVGCLRTIGVDLQKKIVDRYAHNPTNRYILSSGGIFFVSLAAACGKIRQSLNEKYLQGAFERLDAIIIAGEDDPLNLEDYQRVLQGIKTSRGKAMRRLVYDTFLRFFNGTTMNLDWVDAARQMSL